MLINNDVQTSQAAHRQRRHAADEKARVERVAVETGVREGVARQAGEAPTREEVAQFRNLMQSQGRDDRTLAGKPPGTEARPTTDGAATPKFGGALAGLNTAERFRAMLQNAFAPVDERKDEPVHNERAASPSHEAPAPKSDRQDLAPNPARADDAQRTAETEQQPMRSSETPTPRSEPVKTAPDDAAAPNGKQGVENKRKVDSGDAETAQALARKAADGETQAAPTARVAHGEDDMEGGGDAGAAQTGSGSTPTPMSAETANAPQPQQQAANGAQQAQAAASFGNVAPALSELVQKHVRQMLVSDPRSTRGRSREVLLRMQNDVLPGTDLWLTKTDNGWQLRADVRSRDAYDTLLASQDELMQRFADSALGKLTIEPIFHA
ncbi:type III secretion HpaP family protein [Dokdonella sp.]|uniref:type III secretion HpaP family protein n=1 Tax=Dokdonella sp. TaxID=2291710 RepID=UPI001AFE2BA3|nr:type III secretion HpaP family protein [Dokdonella sp.]MBO9664235.1 hypothetical protein [Dokdonella sp.]